MKITDEIKLKELQAHTKVIQNWSISQACLLVKF